MILIGLIAIIVSIICLLLTISYILVKSVPLMLEAVYDAVGVFCLVVKSANIIAVTIYEIYALLQYVGGKLLTMLRMLKRGFPKDTRI